jgi:hypothetical protein
MRLLHVIYYKMEAVYDWAFVCGIPGRWSYTQVSALNSQRVFHQWVCVHTLVCMYV